MPVLFRKKKSKRTEDYCLNRNRIVIVREKGGLGDILMHRMLFEDIKKSTNCELHFACPRHYHEAVTDHPFLDAVVDSANINLLNYGASWNTTTACLRYETAIAPFSDKHRSDIWAQHCGIKLTNHNMYLRLSQREIEWGENVSDKNVLFCPVSAQDGKNLSVKQITGVLQGLYDMGVKPILLHDRPIRDVNWATICGLNLRQWMSVINAAVAVVSVDTSHFHLAGGLGRPTVGIFTFADGKVYGRYYPNVEIVQKHRDDGNWSCGPCYNWLNCPKLPGFDNQCKPCLTELTVEEILAGCAKLFKKNHI